MFRIALPIIFILIIVASGRGADIRIPTDYPTIQAGINAAANGDTVIVADGVYRGVGNRGIDFKSKKIKVTSLNGPEKTTIDCEGLGRGFYFHSSETTESVLSGFTIKNGLADNGGGISCESSSSPTIERNIIIGNYAQSQGGGIFCKNYSSPLIQNNSIIENKADANGGGICCLIESSPVIQNNDISSNTFGGIYCDTSHPKIRKNNITNNSSVTSEGGGSGAGICLYNSSLPIIDGNKILKNTAGYIGGGILCRGSCHANILNNQISENSPDGIWCHGSSPLIQNNEVSRNIGTGIYCRPSASPKIVNNTIVGNAGNRGGIHASFYSYPKVTNTIIWANSPKSLDVSSGITVIYSNVQGGKVGEGNVNVDPLFVDAGKGDYRLKSNSPCIDAGIMTEDVLKEDIEGNPRPNPLSPKSDMGAYEYTEITPQPLPIVDWGILMIDLGKDDISQGILLHTHNDGVTEPANIEGRDCRIILKAPPTSPNVGNHIYFNVDIINKASENKLWVGIEYFDKSDGGATGIILDYDDKGDSAFALGHPQDERTVSFTGTNQWKIAIIPIEEAEFKQQGNGADFRFHIFPYQKGVFYLNRVWISNREFKESDLIGEPNINSITSGPSANNITTTSAIVVWSTDQISNSIVEYGTAGKHDLKVESANNVTNHSVLLNSLSPNTVYYYRVGSADTNGNMIWSDQKTFKTLQNNSAKVLSITSAEVFPGSNTDVQVKISDATGLAGIDLTIKYDADIITFDDLTATDIVSRLNFIVNRTVPGKVTIALAGVKGIESGGGSIIDISLMISSNAKPLTQTNLSFSDAKIYDEFGTNIPVDTEDGIIKINQSGMKGDVNGDREIRANDAILALRIVAGLIKPTDDQKWSADMNDDGDIRANDAILILRKASGFEAPAKDFIADRRIRVSLSEAHGLKGETVTVPIIVDNTDTLSCGDMSITYDSTVLRAVDVLPSDGLLTVTNITHPGITHISFAGTDKLKDERLVEIKFEVLTDDVSPLAFKTAELYSHDALPLNSNFINSQFRSWAVAPEQDTLLQNYPNPFNPETWIPYHLHEANEVVIRIHNVTGELIRELKLGYKPAGIYSSQGRSAYWDGKNESGEYVSSGVYFYTIKAGVFAATKKMIIQK